MAKKLSHSALSQASPTEPIEGGTPAFRQRAPKPSEVYAAEAYAQQLASIKAKPSMSRTGCCYETHGAVLSFRKSGTGSSARSWAMREEARRDLFGYIEGYYNRQPSAQRPVMYKHILIPTDGSELATRGLLHGFGLAKNQGAAVTIITVTEMWSALAMAQQARGSTSRPTERYEEQAAEAARIVLEEAVKLAQSQGISAETRHVVDQHPAEGIIATATDRGCDLIVMASHGRRGLSRIMLASQTYEVLSHSTVPVLVVR